MQGWSEETKLKSLTFKSQALISQKSIPALTSVQCKMTKGFKSETFESPENLHTKKEDIRFADISAIAAIEVQASE